MAGDERQRVGADTPVWIGPRGRTLLDRARLGVLLFHLLLPLLLVVWSRAGGATLAHVYTDESGPVTWFSTIQLLLLALTCYVQGRLENPASGVDPGRARAWFAQAGVALLLALDERFEFHEWFGERVLVEGFGLRDGLGIDADDLVLPAVLLLGLAPFLRWTRRVLDPGRRRWITVALVLAVSGVALDTVDADITGSWSPSGFWTGVVPECLELWAVAAWLLAALASLRDRPGATTCCDWREALRTEVPRARGALLAVNVALPLGFLVYAAWSGTDFNELFWGERDAISWLSSLQLLAIGGLAFVHLLLAPRVGLLRWLWLAFSAGFTFLALEDRFEIHEALRDEVLRPGEILTDVSFLRPGDVVQALYLLLGLPLVLLLWRRLRPVAAQRMFLAATVLTALLTAVDSVAEQVLQALPLREFWDGSVEEIGEIWAQALFLLAFLSALSWRLDHGHPDAGPATDSRAVRPR